MPEESFKLVDEKHVPSEVDMMLWSPKLDLIALANSHGEVVLHRLSWQKVWTLPSLGEGEKVGGLAWRPDGKVLGVGYMSGKLRLCDVEKGEVLHSSDVEGEITCMSWIAQYFPEGSSWTSEPYKEDSSAQFLPKVQPLNKQLNEGSVSKSASEEVVEDVKKLKDQKELNILVIGTNRDVVHLLAYGIFKVASVAFMIQDGSQERRVCSATITEDLCSLSFLVESTSDESDEIDYYLLTFDTKVLRMRHKEIRLMALQYGQVLMLIEHIQTTVTQMLEAWEDILTEMDAKLLKFAEEKCRSAQGTVSNDFLELLLFGTPSPELQNFLLHELTEKGLKKLGFSIETSYSNIQKLVVKHLQTASQALIFHLTHLQGMAQWQDCFGVLGLDADSIQEAVKAAGSLVISSYDLQQVIDSSIKNFKAFFRWLYVVILRLSKEEIPSELSKMTQHEVSFVAEFLRDNFSHFVPEESSLFADELCREESASSLLAKEGRPGFKLEKVGQYLKREDLTHPSHMTENPWVQFVHTSPGLSDSRYLYPTPSSKSLLQLQDAMEQAVQHALQHPAEVIRPMLGCTVIYHLYTLTTSDTTTSHPHPHRHPRVCQFTDCRANQSITAFTASFLPSDVFYILRQATDSGSMGAQDSLVALTTGGVDLLTQSDRPAARYVILDLAVYDQKTLTVLLQEDSADGRPALVQFPILSINTSAYCNISTTENIITAAGLQHIALGQVLPTNAVQHLQHMKAHSLAVSGSRKTATVLFQSRRRVRVFLMEAEEEDEEEEERDKEESWMMQDSSLHATDTSRVSISDNDSDENKENTSTSGCGTDL